MNDYHTILTLLVTLASPAVRADLACETGNCHATILIKTKQTHELEKKDRDGKCRDGGPTASGTNDVVLNNVQSDERLLLGIVVVFL